MAGIAFGFTAAFAGGEAAAAFDFGLAFALGVLWGVLGGALRVAAFGFGAGFVLGALLGSLDGAGRARRRSGDLNVTTAGLPAAACSFNAGSNGGEAGAAASDLGSASFGAASTTRRSGTAARLSCQGKVKPGSPNSLPPKVRLNRNA